MKDVTSATNTETYEEALQKLFFRSSLHSTRASRSLLKTRAGQRAFQSFFHICLEQSSELTATDWTSLATLSLAAANSAPQERV